MSQYYRSKLCEQLKLRLPIIQAPMAGGLVTPSLIAGVVKAGGLGSLPLGYLSVAEAQQAIRKTKASTPTGFSVNLFIPDTKIRINQTEPAPILEHINTYRAALGLAVCSELPSLIEPNVNDLLEMIVGEGVSILSFTFGTFCKSTIDKLHSKGLYLMGTATTVLEGLELQAMGCDAVIAQGYEAGGHRGGDFLENHSGGLIGTMALVPQMSDALTIPVIAAGGIMDGRGIIAALALGASAVQLGTAFLTCDESGASAMHRHLVLNSSEDATCITPVFTGKPARGFKNQYVMDTEKKFQEAKLLPYPVLHELTKEFRTKANKIGQAEYASLWSGQGTRLSRVVSVEVLMHKLEEEMAFVISSLE